MFLWTTGQYTSAIVKVSESPCQFVQGSGGACRSCLFEEGYLPHEAVVLDLPYSPVVVFSNGLSPDITLQTTTNHIDLRV